MSTKYVLVWKRAGMQRSKRLMNIKFETAEQARSMALTELKLLGPHTLITVYGHHDNGFVDPYEYFARVSSTIYRCFYNQMTKKLLKGDKAATEIAKLTGHTPSYKSDGTVPDKSAEEIAILQKIFDDTH